MQSITYKDKILSIIYRKGDWIKGLNFITPDDLFIQAGSWWYDKGKILQTHTHLEFPREATRTQESVYVISGSMKCSIYTEEKTFLEDFILYEGDLAIFAHGGHGYEILQDDTRIIETKNGPFTGVESDKIKF